MTIYSITNLVAFNDKNVITFLLRVTLFTVRFISICSSSKGRKDNYD